MYTFVLRNEPNDDCMILQNFNIFCYVFVIMLDLEQIRMTST